MFSVRKICLILLGLFAAILAAMALHSLYFTVLLGSGFMAQTLCSGMFVAGGRAGRSRNGEATLT
jgi:hypothetical protein